MKPSQQARRSAVLTAAAAAAALLLVLSVIPSTTGFTSLSTSTTTFGYSSHAFATSRPALTNLHSPYTTYSTSTLFGPPPSSKTDKVRVSPIKKKRKQKSSKRSSEHKKTNTGTTTSTSNLPQQHHHDHHKTTTTTRTTTTTSEAGASCASSLLNNRHSASDWWYNVRSLPQSKVLREVRNPVLCMAGWSLFVSIVHKVLSASSGSGGPSWMARVAQHMCIPAAAHSFLVSALGLLLVFRTNSAYQRFYEGRKIWEDILSVSRNFSRMIQLYSKDVGSERKQQLMNLVAAYPYLLRHHIRPGCLCENTTSSSNSDSSSSSSNQQQQQQQPGIDEKHRLLLHEPSFVTVETRYEGDSSSGGQTRLPTTQASECWVDRRNLPWSLFSSKKPSSSSSTTTKRRQRRRRTAATSDLDKIARARNRPLWICDKLSRHVVDIPYSPNFTSRERLSLLGQIDKLTNAVGQCERIQQTAVPLNYARHSLRSLTLWLASLPFCLVQDLGLATAPVIAGIAWLLLGVYQIGYSIEDPFAGSLRLSILCDAIRRDVLDSGNMGCDEDDDFDDEEEDYEDDDEEDDELFSSSNHDSSSLFHNTRRTIFDDSSFLPAPPTTMKEINGQWAVVSAGR